MRVFDDTQGRKKAVKSQLTIPLPLRVVRCSLQMAIYTVVRCSQMKLQMAIYAVVGQTTLLGRLWPSCVTTQPSPTKCIRSS